MEKKDIVTFWKTEAEDSKRVAWHLFEKKDFSYALFFGHLAIEKIIKAIYVKNIGVNIPRSHNLPRLAKVAGIIVPEEIIPALIRITGFNIESRYPDYKKKFRDKCTSQFTKNELEKIDKVFIWLKSILS